MHIIKNEFFIIMTKYQWKMACPLKVKWIYMSIHVTIQQIFLNIMHALGIGSGGLGGRASERK